MLSHTELWQLREKLREEYEKGESIWALSIANPQVPKKWIRLILDDLVQKRLMEKDLPVNEEEVAQRVLEISSKWTPEEASRRWVGRAWDSRERLQASASRLMPD
jgi:hypothetical protein